ncbi:hypothetical protein D5E80_13450 [Vibrio parahaemolyticus]|nr:hypothetical protein D5E80_13450 [Vibrio parahaemolyticus]
MNYKHHNFLLFFRSLLRQQANEKRMLVSRRVKQSTKFFAKNDVLEALLSKRLYYLLFLLIYCSFCLKSNRLTHCIT